MSKKENNIDEERLAAAEAELKAAQEKLEELRAGMAAKPEDSASEEKPQEEQGSPKAPHPNSRVNVNAATAAQTATAAAMPIDVEPVEAQSVGSTAGATTTSSSTTSATGSSSYSIPNPQSYTSGTQSGQTTYGQSYATYTSPGGQQYYVPNNQGRPVPPAGYVESKDHVVAGLLGIFLGWLGIHKFYLGYNTAGFIMLGATILGSILSFGIAGFVIFVIGLIEGIIYLTKTQAEFDSIYVSQTRDWF